MGKFSNLCHTWVANALPTVALSLPVCTLTLILVVRIKTTLCLVTFTKLTAPTLMSEK